MFEYLYFGCLTVAAIWAAYHNRAKLFPWLRSEAEKAEDKFKGKS